MPRVSRNLLLAAALGSVAPAAAHPLIAAEECPYSKASGTVLLTSNAPGEVPVVQAGRAYMP